MLDQKRRDRLYGQTIADFIHAKTTDEACLGLVKHIQELQGFSSSFSRKAVNAFPLLSTYTALPGPEKMLFDHFYKWGNRHIHPMMARNNAPFYF